MAFGFGFGFAKNYVAATLSAFNPTSLFAAGEQGVYFDPNNSAALFEDAAGTIPTALERPVGLMLDQSKGLVLGPELVTNGWTDIPTTTSSIVNGKLRVTQGTNGTYSNYALNTKVGTTYLITFNSYVVSPGTFYVIPKSAQNGAGSNIALISGSSNTTYRGVFTATTTSEALFIQVSGTWDFDNISVRELPGNHATSSSTARPTLTRRVNQFVNSEALPTQSVTTRATTQTLQFSGTGTIALSGTATGVYTAGTYSVTTTAGTLTATVLGTVTRADLREANFGVGLPAYQRVGNTSVNAADYDTTGFPAWLRCSGGQSMVTPSINFTGTDKMTVWAGVRKLSDAARGMVAELSASGQPGIFGLNAPAGTTPTYSIYNAGSVGVGPITTASSFPAPESAVVTFAGDISAPKTLLRRNASQVVNDSQVLGTGTYGNYPLYLFARNQTSLFFNGLAGPIIVRGAQSSAAEIANAENWINAQQKVY